MYKKITIAIILILAILSLAGVNKIEAQEENFEDKEIDKINVEGLFFAVSVHGRDQNSVKAKVIIPDNLVEQGVEVRQEINGTELSFIVIKKSIFGVNIYNKRKTTIRSKIIINNFTIMKNHPSGKISKINEQIYIHSGIYA